MLLITLEYIANHHCRSSLTSYKLDFNSLDCAKPGPGFVKTGPNPQNEAIFWIYLRKNFFGAFREFDIMLGQVTTFNKGLEA